MTIETPRHDIVPIQMLRGVAAAMVVVFHCNTQLTRMGHDHPALSILAAGVDIFFVISGFFMWVSKQQAPGRTAGQFFLNRLVRIVPLYWAITLGIIRLTYH